MWEKKKQEDTKAFLGKGAEFIGKLIFNGNVRIDGDFEGEIFGQGSVDVGQGALVKANMAVDSLHIGGEVQGSIEVKQYSFHRQIIRRCTDAGFYYGRRCIF
jgi:cytoskeletal protein CcmA (bactofilin family)